MEYTDINKLLCHAIQNQYELIFHDPHTKTVSLCNGEEKIITEPFKAPDRYSEGMYYVVGALREDYIKFRLAYPKSTSICSTVNAQARYLLLTCESEYRILTLPVNQNNIFEVFVDHLGAISIDFAQLDMVVKYNYELKLAIMRMRRELDDLERLIQ